MLHEHGMSWCGADSMCSAITQGKSNSVTQRVKRLTVMYDGHVQGGGRIEGLGVLVMRPACCLSHSWELALCRDHRGSGDRGLHAFAGCARVQELCDAECRCAGSRCLYLVVDEYSKCLYRTG